MSDETPATLPARSLFHLAFHVSDLDEARRFYGGVLGCREGRSTGTWVDFDFFSHQISLHLGEQWTMFFCDPFGNPIEVKGFPTLAGVFEN